MSTAVSGHAVAPVPEPVARVGELMSTYGHTWALCGGWAVDAWLGRETREHADLDITVFQDDQRALFEHLRGGWDLIGHDPNVAGNTSEPWDGRRLDIPGHIHGRVRDASSNLPYRLDEPAQQGFDLDIQICERAGGDWVFSREPRITLAMDGCVRESGWGLPTLAAEAVLLYKSGAVRSGDDLGFLRRRDKLDFLALLPHLTDEQRDWLRKAISLVGHPWLSQLSA